MFKPTVVSVFLGILVLIWFGLVSIFQTEGDTGGPLFFLGAGLLILTIPLVVTAGLLWLLWTFFRSS